MKYIYLLFINIILLPFFAWAQIPSSVKPTLQSKPKWITYQDLKYGFSFRYDGDRIPNPLPASGRPGIEKEISIPIVICGSNFVRDGITFLTCSDKNIGEGIKYHQANRNKKTECGGDAWGLSQFSYHMNDFARLLQLPVGTQRIYDGLKYRVLLFHRVKALFAKFDPFGNEGANQCFIIPRGKDRWLEIDLNHGDVYDGKTGEHVTGAEGQDLKGELDFLRTVEFFDPK
jgi:hypothetical protein